MNARSAIFLALLVGPAAGLAKTPNEEARDHYIAGTKAFDLTHYDEAITEFEAAYRAKDDPVFLYNIAQAHRLAGHLEKAVRFYRNYLRLQPDSPQRVEIERRISEMQKAIETERNQFQAPPSGTIAPALPLVPPGEPVKTEPPKAEAPKPAPPTPEPPQLSPAAAATSQPADQLPAELPAKKSAPRGKALKLAGLGLLIGGALIAAGGGIGFSLLAEEEASAVNAASRTNPPTNDTSWRGHYDAIGTDQALAIVFEAAGGAIAVTGATLLVLGLRAAKAESPPKTAAWRLVPSLGPRAAGFAVGGSF